MYWTVYKRKSSLRGGLDDAMGKLRWKWDHSPLRNYWPIRAFISDTWEEVEDGGPGVHHTDKLPSIQLLATCLPSSLPPNLHLIPSSSLSFVCLLSLLPLPFWSPSISADRVEWYELNKPQELNFFHLFLLSHPPVLRLTCYLPNFSLSPWAIRSGRLKKKGFYNRIFNPPSKTLWN